MIDERRQTRRMWHLLETIHAITYLAPEPTTPATLLREHRGDGHVAAMVAHGDEGLDGHVLFAATGAVDRSTLQPNRGWTDDEWQHHERRLGE